MIFEKNNVKENRVHGSVMFPLVVYFDRCIDSFSPLDCHWHEEIEIIYVEKGELAFNINMEPIKVSAGQCFIINSEYLHSAYAIEDKSSVHHAIVFNLNILNSSIYDYCQNKYIDPMINKKILFPFIIEPSSEWGEKCICEVKELIKCFQNKTTGWELSIKASLFKFISILAASNKFEMQDNINSSSNNYKVELIKKTLNYIHNNYNKKIYIDTLASEINLSTQYFCKFFKALTGKTPVDYILHYRIEQAAKLLQTEDIKILDVCYRVGFENFSYFIKKFKNFKNCTPSKFKKI